MLNLTTISIFDLLCHLFNGLKKTITILFLMTQLLAIVGPLAVHQYLVYQSDRFYNEQAGKGKYNVSDLTEVVIPVYLPHITDWTAYEQVSGQIQFKYTCYNYVGLKLTHNAMYLMCVPNYEHTQLLGQNVINAKGVKGKPLSKREHVPFATNTYAPQFHINLSAISFELSFRQIRTFFAVLTQPSSQHQPGTPKQPPRYC